MRAQAAQSCLRVAAADHDDAGFFAQRGFADGPHDRSAQQRHFDTHPGGFEQPHKSGFRATEEIFSGGKLVNEKRVNAANLTGTDIADGQTHHVVKGDVLIVPNNTPHQVVPGGGAPIVVMTMHVPMPAPANWP